MPYTPFTRVLTLALLAATATLAAHAQGGPPFRTDDPETPGDKHWEINFGFIGDRNPGGGDYEVPNFDFNYGLGDRIQLKYEVPIAIHETRAQPATATDPAVDGQVIGGLGESLLGIKWRFYEHHPKDEWVKDRFGTGLMSVFGHAKEDREAAGHTGHAVGGADAPEELVNLSVSTYPQLFLDNPTRAVPRGVVTQGPQFYLPLEVNGRIGPIRFDGEVGYNFGNKNVPQSWGRGLLVGHEFGERTEAYVELYDVQETNRLHAEDAKARESTLGLGGRQALNKAKTLNLLLMGGRSFQKITANNTQPSWIAYVGLQVLLGPKEPVAPGQVEQKLPDEGKK